MAMTKPCAAAPICCFPSARLPGRTCSPVRCSPNSFTAQPRSLRTTPIIAKVEAMRAARVAATLACVALIGAGGPAERLAEAQREAARSAARIGQLDQAAQSAADEATKYNARAAALAARVQQAEAVLTTAEARIALLDDAIARSRKALEIGRAHV